MPVSSSIYQFLNPRDVQAPDGLGSFRQGYTIGSDLEQQRQNSLLGQMRLAELQRQQQVEDQFRARLRQEYAQGGTAGAPGLAGLAEGGAPGAVAPVQEVVNTPYGPDLQAMLSQYQQEGADVTPTPGARPLPGGPDGMAAGAPAAGLAAAAPGMGAAGSRPASTLLRDLGMIDPLAARKYEKEEIDRDKSRFDLLERQNDLVASTARSILQDDTQAGYERGVAYLRSVGIPVDHLPRYYDRKMVEQYEAWSTDTKTQLGKQRLALDTLTERRLGKESARQDVELGLKLTEEERKAHAAAAQIPEYVKGEGLLNAAIHPYMQERGLTGEPPPDILRQGRQDIEQGKVNVSAAQGAEQARLKREQEPLDPTTAKAVSDIGVLQDMTDDVTDLFDPGYVGQFEGRWGAVKAWAGQAPQRQVVFQRVVADMKDQLLRARSGAAITESEYARLSTMVPNVTDNEETFQAKLLGFRRALDQTKQRKLETATTGRGQLRGAQPGVTPLPGGGTKTITEADITATMEAQAKAGTPKTRQQILDDARQKGFTLQGT